VGKCLRSRYKGVVSLIPDDREEAVVGASVGVHELDTNGQGEASGVLSEERDVGLSVVVANLVATV